MAANILSSSMPLAPQKGMPCISSCAPGASPISISLACGLLLTGSVFATPKPLARVLGDLFDEESNRTKLLYKFETVISKDEKTPEFFFRENNYFDLQGNVVASEKVQIKVDEILRYELDQKQTGIKATVEIKDNKVHYTYGVPGAQKTAVEKAEPGMIIGPSMIHYLMNRWDQLIKGETVSARFIVPERLETVGFKYFKEEETKFDGKDAVVIKMKPSSIIIAAIVTPLYIYFSKDGSMVYAIKGRTLPKQKKGDSWKDLDVMTVYHMIGENPLQSATAKH